MNSVMNLFWYNQAIYSLENYETRSARRIMKNAKNEF